MGTRRIRRNVYNNIPDTIISDRNIMETIINRATKANNTYYQICNSITDKKGISTKVKTKIYKIVYLPSLLHGLETWIMLDKHKSRVTSSEMKYAFGKIIRKNKER